MDTTAEAFKKFYLGCYIYDRPAPQGVDYSKETLYQWKKGVKCDPLAFSTLKYDEQVLEFRNEFEAQAAIQGVDEVLDPQHKPRLSNNDAILLFKAKNEFIYTVLLYKVQTAVGKDIVRKFMDAKDGQKAWKALIKEWKESSASALQANDYMT